MQGDGLETHQERLDRLRKLAEKPEVKEAVKSKRSVRRALLKARKKAAEEKESGTQTIRKGRPLPSLSISPCPNQHLILGNHTAPILCSNVA